MSRIMRIFIVKKLPSFKPFGPTLSGSTSADCKSLTRSSSSKKRDHEHQQWYHGDISREECQKRLAEMGFKDGTFLVRKRGNYFVLSTCWDNDVSHYLINVDKGKYGIPGGRIFANLNQMVSYYSHRKDGLPCCLRSVCPRPVIAESMLPHEQNGTLSKLDTTAALIHPDKQSDQSGSNPLHRESDILSDCFEQDEKPLQANGDIGPELPPKIVPNKVILAPATSTDSNTLPYFSSTATRCRGRSTSRSQTDSPYFNFTPLSMQQSSSFTGVDCLEVLERLEADDTNDEDDRPDTTDLHWKHNDLQSPNRGVCITPDIKFNEFSDSHEIVSKGQYVIPPSVRRRSNCEDYLSRRLNGMSITSKRNSHQNEYSLPQKLKVDDHQPLINNMAAKKDYIHNSTEHRSESSPSPSNTNSGANSNSNSAHLNSVSPHCRSLRGTPSSSAKFTGGGTQVPPPPPSPTWNEGLMNAEASVRSSPTVPKVGNHAHLDPEASLEENVLENCDLYLYYQLGVGNFGVVMQGVLRNLDSGKERSVAVKILRCTEGETAESSRQQMLREAKVMSELNHPNVIKLIGIFNGPELMLVSELAPVGQLNKYLKRNHGVPVEMLMNYALQVANGMAYLERKSFVHRDLAARNVLLATDRHARISDFGMSRMLSFNKDYYRANDGGHWPVRWYAPQCIYFFTFTSKSDVWSYGVTLWEIFSYGQRPYGSMCSSEIMQMLDKGARLKCPAGCPPEMYTLMLRCWEYEEADRPTFEEIFQVVEIYFRAQASRSRDVYTG